MSNLAHLPTPRASNGNKTVAANIRAELGYAGQSQGVLAAALGFSDMALSRRLNSQTEFTASEIVSIASYFGITPGALFEVRERPRPVNDV